MVVCLPVCPCLSVCLSLSLGKVDTGGGNSRLTPADPNYAAYVTSLATGGQAAVPYMNFTEPFNPVRQTDRHQIDKRMGGWMRSGFWSVLRF